MAAKIWAMDDGDSRTTEELHHRGSWTGQRDQVNNNQEIVRASEHVVGGRSKGAAAGNQLKHECACGRRPDTAGSQRSTICGRRLKQCGFKLGAKNAHVAGGRTRLGASAEQCMWQAAGRGWEPALNNNVAGGRSNKTSAGSQASACGRRPDAAGSQHLSTKCGRQPVQQDFGWEPGMCMWQAAGCGWEPAQARSARGRLKIRWNSMMRLAGTAKPANAVVRAESSQDDIDDVGALQDRRTSSSDIPSKHPQASSFYLQHRLCLHICLFIGRCDSKVLACTKAACVGVLESGPCPIIQST